MYFILLHNFVLKNCSYGSDIGGRWFWNVGTLEADYMALQARRWQAYRQIFVCVLYYISGLVKEIFIKVCYLTL